MGCIREGASFFVVLCSRHRESACWSFPYKTTPPEVVSIPYAKHFTVRTITIAAMATQLGEELSHVVLPLTAPPSSSFYSEAQWKVWYALMDTLIPCIVPTAGGLGPDKLQISQSSLDGYFETIQSKVTNPPSREAFDAYLLEKPSENQVFKDHMVRTLSLLPKDAQGQIGSVLSLMGLVTTPFNPLYMMGLLC